MATYDAMNDSTIGEPGAAGSGSGERHGEGDGLAGRVALVTGASGGIGRALATRLSLAGVDLALTYGRHRDGAEAVAADARSRGRRVLLLEGDLSDPAVPTRLIDRAEADLGAIDVLVANAGHGVQRSWDAVDPVLWDTTMAVNARAPFFMAQRVLPGMAARGFGRVLFVSSVAALTGGVVGPHYAASKAALHGLTHHLASRVAKQGVTVNAIAPALVAGTGMLPVDPGQPEEPPVPIPVGRLGRPEEVADLSVAILANPYLTSKVIALDGGIHPY
jgi:3-oxoacyl-[acyl-carrier protein] reductase